jgi:type II secretory pathway component PulJ
MNTRGFTLMETLIYIALFGVLILGVLSFVEPLFRGVERNNTKVTQEVEIQFVSRAIIATLNQARTITTPSTGSTSTTLSLTTESGATYDFAENNGSITKRTGVQSPLPLTSSRVKDLQVLFTHIPPSAQTPRALSFTLTAASSTFGPYRTYFYF